MRNVIPIARKELNIYFATPLAYGMLALFGVVASYFFLRLLGNYEMLSLQYMRFNSPEMMNRLNFQDLIFRGLFGNLGVVLMFVVPFLTMRLVAEEKRTRTIELLYTTPVTSADIVLGKYLAALVLLALALVITLFFPALVQLLAKDAAGVEWHSVAMSSLGLFLMGASFMALGLFISSLTENVTLAALITWVLLLLTWIIGWAAGEVEGTARELILYLCSTTHLDSFSRGVLDLKDLVYFASFITVGLFATHRAVEAHRWS
jgi:ABC-2 type transport system permease protein